MFAIINKVLHLQYDYINFACQIYWEEGSFLVIQKLTLENAHKLVQKITYSDPECFLGLPTHKSEKVVCIPAIMMKTTANQKSDPPNSFG